MEKIGAVGGTVATVFIALVFADYCLGWSRKMRNRHAVNPQRDSLGHLGYLAGMEYFRSGSGLIWVADCRNRIDSDGYRTNAHYVCYDVNGISPWILDGLHDRDGNPVTIPKRR